MKEIKLILLEASIIIVVERRNVIFSTLTILPMKQKLRNQQIMKL